MSASPANSSACVTVCSCPCFCATLPPVPATPSTQVLSSDFFARLVSNAWPCPALYSKGSNICPPQVPSGTSHCSSSNPTPGHPQLPLSILHHLWLLATPPLPVGSLPHSSLPAIGFQPPSAVNVLHQITGHQSVRQFSCH